MPADLHRTPFHDLHVSLGAKLVDFAGWEMPLSYTGIVDEHKKCRESGGFFDVSHMGRLRFEGPDAAAFLSFVTTRDVDALSPGQSRYALVTNDRGGIEDDVIIARWHDGVSMVCNAGNREKLLAHFEAVRSARGFDARVVDLTFGTAMAALQGPKAFEEVGGLLAGQLDEDPRELKRFGCAKGSVMGMPIEVYRSGYTGEDGFEVVTSADAAKTLAGMMGSGLKDGPVYACGLGARDTLRIEASLPLYGHELGPDVTPAAVGFGWAVGKTHEFVGSDAVRAELESGPQKRLIGLELDSKRTARQGQAVLLNDVQVGVVTSGTFGPTIGRSVAMAFVAGDVGADVTQTLGVDFRREVVQATAVPMPFYRRPEGVRS